jgi:hypothetical protein
MARRSTAACKAASRAPLCVPPATSEAVARFQRRMRAVGSMLEGAPEAIADTAVRSVAATSGAARMRRSTVLSAAPTSAGGQGAYLRNVVDVVVVDVAVDSQYSTKSAFWTWSYLQKLKSTNGVKTSPGLPRSRTNPATRAQGPLEDAQPHDPMSSQGTEASLATPTSAPVKGNVRYRLHVSVCLSCQQALRAPSPAYAMHTTILWYLYYY